MEYFLRLCMVLSVLGVSVHGGTTLKERLDGMSSRLQELASQNIELSTRQGETVRQRNVSDELQAMVLDTDHVVRLFDDLEEENKWLKEAVLDNLSALTVSQNCILNNGGTPSCPEYPLLKVINLIHTLTTRTSAKVNALEKALFRRDCADIQRQYRTTVNGVYTIHIEGTPVKVYCDFTTDGGGWTVFQRRVDGSTDFYRTWDEYKAGFGDPSKEYWLGNDHLHLLTVMSNYSLRVDLADWENHTAYASYNHFMVGNPAGKYRLSVSGYSGNAGDSFTYHNGRPFSTKDADNDKHRNHCAQIYKGGWWYKKCHVSNLNGHFYRGHHDTYAEGVNWRAWKGYHYSLKAEMKIRPTPWNI